MKTLRLVSIIAIAASLAVTGCGKKEAKAPVGQVVATVDGEEITARELQAEMAGMTFPDDKTRKLAEQRALKQIIDRRVLAKEARAQGIDKTPDFAIQQKRAEDTVLVQSYQQSIAKSVPASSPEEAQRFIIDHPDIFAQRKIFVIDQLRTQANLPPALAAQLQPMKSIDEVVALLQANNIPFQRLPNKLDSVGSDPKLVDQIIKLKPGDMFAVPANGVLLINQVKSTTIEPFTGQKATDYATQLLTRQHSQEAVLRQFNAALQKVDGKVEYAKGYAPPAATKAPAATNAPAPK